MNDENPYQAPDAELTVIEQPLDALQIRRLFLAKRWLLAAIMMYPLLPLCAWLIEVMGGFDNYIDSLLWDLWLYGTAAMGIGSVYWGALQLKLRWYFILVLNIGMLIPVLNWLILADIDRRATKRLRAAGVDVGFFRSKRG